MLVVFSNTETQQVLELEEGAVGYLSFVVVDLLSCPLFVHLSHGKE